MKYIFINKDLQIRSGWKILLTYIIFFILTLLLSIPVNFIMITNMILSNGTNEIDMNLIQAQIMNINNLFGFLTILMQELAMIIVPLLMWKFVDKKKLKYMGLPNIRYYLKDLLVGLLFGAMCMTIIFILIILFGNGSLAYSILKPQFSISLLTNLVLFILVGLGEEILNRGYIMSVLKQTKNIYIIFILPSLVFSLIHLGNPNFSILACINIFLVGLLFAYMFIKSNNIFMPIGFHISWNYFQGNVFGFRVSGLEQVGLYQTNIKSENIINGGFFGPEGGLAVTLILLLSFLFVKFYYKDSKTEFLTGDKYEV